MLSTDEQSPSNERLRMMQSMQLDLPKSFLDILLSSYRQCRNYACQNMLAWVPSDYERDLQPDVLCDSHHNTAYAQHFAKISEGLICIMLSLMVSSDILKECYARTVWVASAASVGFDRGAVCYIRQ